MAAVVTGHDYRARVFATTWLAYAGFYLCRKNFSVVMPYLQTEGGLGKTQLADILFAYSLCYAGGQFLMGALADRWKPRLVVTAGLAAAILANLLMSLHTEYWPLLLLSTMNGLGQATGWPSLIKTMAAWFPPSERGVAMAWWSTNYVLGGFLATLLASIVVGAFAWRAAFWLPALVLMAVAAIYFCFVGDLPTSTPADDDTKAVLAGTAIVKLPTVNLPIVNSVTPLVLESVIVQAAVAHIPIVKRPIVWLTATVAFLLKVTRYSFLYWLPLYLTERLSFRPDQAGYLSSAYELLGFGGAIAAGYASDRLFGGRRFPVAAIMLAGLAGACYLHPRMAALGWTGTLLSITLIGFMTYGPDTLMQGAASQDAGTGRDAAATAGFICGIASLGQLVSPYLVAWVATTRGWDELFLFFVAVAAAGAILSALGWNLKATATS